MRSMTWNIFSNVDNLEGEDTPTVKDILDMDVDGLQSDDEVQTEQFSRLAGERTGEPQPVLETANQLKTNFRQESQAPKVASSTEKVTTRAEDLGV